VDINPLINIEELKGLHLDVMFAALPKNLVADTSKKFSKRKTKNLFYIIYGVWLKESNQYVIFLSIFQSLKKSSKGPLYKEVLVDSVVYEDKREVLNYIYDFINNFSEHDRLINEEIMQLGVMKAEDAFTYLLAWNGSVFTYFNELIKNKNSAKGGGFFSLFK
jgi:hypothetical protein